MFGNYLTSMIVASPLFDKKVDANMRSIIDAKKSQTKNLARRQTDRKLKEIAR